MAFHDLEKDKIIIEKLECDKIKTLNDMAESFLNPTDFVARLGARTLLSKLDKTGKKAFDTKDRERLAEALGNLINTEKTENLIKSQKHDIKHSPNLKSAINEICKKENFNINLSY